METRKILVAIPLMDEWGNLHDLLQDINNQTLDDYHVVFCVNQPEDWWQLPEKVRVCQNNSKTLGFLSSFHDFSFSLLDKSSPGKGWKGKEHGVGWARKVAMDHSISMSGPHDIVISLDADTRMNPEYFESVLTTLNNKPGAVALSVPYYHRLTGKEDEDRAILRYEIYMRYYVLNLWRIDCPYSFSALGSAIAFPVRSYKAIRGMTPNKSGEDFYFLQKLRKYGPLLFWNPEKVYPAARFSDRVFFGTGPAMIKGKDHDWSSYPLYAMEHFNLVKDTYKSFPELFSKKVSTPMDEFLKGIFNEEDVWEPLRKNHQAEHRFIRACHEKVDGLRVLQFLKAHNVWGNNRDETHLKQYFRLYVEPSDQPGFLMREDFSFLEASVQELDIIRNILQNKEERFQQEHCQIFNP
ncbi:MAG: hypothetical protein AB9842_07675 [Bacteroidales bacterium]